MPDHIQQRIELDFTAIDSQIRTWLKEGHDPTDIIKQAKHSWPNLPEDYVRASIKLIRHMMILEKPLPLRPMSDLARIHRRRNRRITRIEADLEKPDAPVSLQTLYRGMLRDHEAACYKILAFQRQEDLDRLQQAKEAARVQRQEDQRYVQQLRQTLRQRSADHHEDEHEEEDQPAPTNHQPRSAPFSAMSWLIGFILALFLTGCTSFFLPLTKGECPALWDEGVDVSKSVIFFPAILWLS